MSRDCCTNPAVPHATRACRQRVCRGTGKRRALVMAPFRLLQGIGCKVPVYARLAVNALRVLKHSESNCLLRERVHGKAVHVAWMWSQDHAQTQELEAGL